MYLPAGQACNQPNSSSPMTQARIDAQARRIMRRGQAFTEGNRVLNNLMAHLTPPVARPSCGDLQSSRGITRGGSPFPEPGGGPSPTVNLMSPAQMQNWYDAWAASSAAAARRANYGALFMPTVGGSSPGVSSGPAAAGAPGRPAAAGSSASSGNGGAAAPGAPGRPAAAGSSASSGNGGAAAPGAPAGAPGYTSAAGGRTAGRRGGASWPAASRPAGGWSAAGASPWPWSLGAGVNATCTNPEVLPVDTVDRPANGSGARSSSLPLPPAAPPAWEFWAALGVIALGIYALSED